MECKLLSAARSLRQMTRGKRRKVMIKRESTVEIVRQSAQRKKFVTLKLSRLFLFRPYRVAACINIRTINLRSAFTSLARSGKININIASRRWSTAEFLAWREISHMESDRHERAIDWWSQQWNRISFGAIEGGWLMSQWRTRWRTRLVLEFKVHRWCHRHHWIAIRGAVTHKPRPNKYKSH